MELTVFYKPEPQKSGNDPAGGAYLHRLLGDASGKSATELS